jgi:thiol-disulfide isomerase/thioredoxin
MSLRAISFPEDLTWINTLEPLSLEKLKGHVILLDFWAYCCINCIHVLNDLKYLEKKYEKEPFTIIGVHSPKFRNEKDEENVRSAVSRYEIGHPVLVDSEMILWKAYGINAWPSLILIGTDGSVIGKVSGEGNRVLLDNAILKALSDGRTSKTIAESKYPIEPEIRIESLLKFPGKLAIDRENSILYVSDSNHNRIVGILLEENDIGQLKIIIGEGRSGFKDGDFETALFNKPQGIAYANNKIFVADTENHAIREIDLREKVVKTVAGNGKQGYTRAYKGDPLTVSLSSPWDIELVDTFLYIAMAGMHQIWRLDLHNEIIEVYAGSGREDLIDGRLQEAALAQTSGLSFDPIRDRLYFADSEVSALRYIDFKDKKVVTLIGKGLFIFGMKSGTLENALLQHPIGVYANGSKVYIADTYNHAIRELDLKSSELSNLIYRPKKGVCKIGDEDCDVLPLYEPNDVVLYKNVLYISDTNNNLIRIFDLTMKTLKDLYIVS